MKSLKSTTTISFLVTKINEKTHLTFLTLNYQMLATFRTMLKANFRNFANNFVKKILTLSWFLIHSK